MKKRKKLFLFQKQLILVRTSINPDSQTLTYIPYINGLAKMWVNRNTLVYFHYLIETCTVLTVPSSR